MATSIADCKKIVDLAKQTGLKYMMMETVVYAREYLFMKELLDQGELGKLQFVQASHQQDMDGWPNYWPGLPPMWYATHCVGPVAGLIGKPAEYVSCFGSRHHPQGTHQVLRLAVRRRDRAHQVPRQRRQRAHHPQPLRHGAAVSREH